MTAENHAEVASEVDESSWVYLSGAATSGPGVQEFRERVVEACEASGWLTVSCSAEERVGRGSDPSRFFESMRHAVEHADLVVSFIGDNAEMLDAELAMAYSHGRPVIGIRIGGSEDSGIQMMLGEYERARVITCANAEECAEDLRATFADPVFAETIRRAQ